MSVNAELVAALQSCNAKPQLSWEIKRLLDSVAYRAMSDSLNNRVENASLASMLMFDEWFRANLLSAPENRQLVDLIAMAKAELDQILKTGPIERKIWTAIADITPF